MNERLRRLGVRDADLEERFVRSGGPGGQNVNKVATCVLLTHRPSGITIRCEGERSQLANRLQARQRLADRLEALREAALRRRKHERELRRRQTRGRSRAGKERMLQTKRLRATVKQQRTRRTLDE